MVVSNEIGAVSSLPAVLNIVASPQIVAQPQSQSVLAGSNVTFFVSVTGGGTGELLPAVGSGTLQLWLRADVGVETNSAGQVSEWDDLSGNENDAVQTNANLQPFLANPSTVGNASVVRFNGIQNSSEGDFLQGTNSVGVSNALTAFMFYEMNSGAPAEQMGMFIGVPGSFGGSRGDYIPGGQMAFTTWSYDYLTGYTIPTNTYRIWTDRFNTNQNLAQLFDDTATSTTNFSKSTSGQSPPQAGYYVGGLNPAVEFVGTGLNFGGDIGEILVYQGALSDPDRLTVLNYLKQKYYQVNGPGLSFQWFLNGTNLPGATNATFYLAAAQVTNAGSYTVVATNAVGSVTSSVAALTIAVPPYFTVQPQSQSNGIDTSVTFSAAAGGNAPLHYQWQLNSVNMANATNTSVTVTNVQSTNGGTYRVVVTNLYGSITSSNAVLTVLTSAVQVVSASAGGSTTVTVPIQLVSAGNENALNFSINFSNAVLTYSSAAVGSNAGSAFLFANASQAGSGRLGLELELASGSFSIGTQQVAVVNFAVANVTNTFVTTITFGTQPTAELVLNAQSATLPATYSAGNVSIAATAWEGDVSPRTNGDGFVAINDWLQEGRFVAGLDTANNGKEFQRADTAPRATQGDGQITVADWVQVGRYAAGLDALETIGGPSAPNFTNSNVASGTRIISLTPLSQNQTTNSIGVQMTAQGNENAVGFSVAFDPVLVNSLSASLGSGASGAVMDVNTNQAASGSLGIALALTPGNNFAAGVQQLVQLSFTSLLYASNVAFAFGDAPVVRQVADTNASILPVSFENATIPVAGSVWPTLGISQAGSNVVLSWPLAAAPLGLQEAPSLGGNWSNVVATPATVGANLVLTSSISTNTEFFRLKH